MQTMDSFLWLVGRQATGHGFQGCTNVNNHTPAPPSSVYKVLLPKTEHHTSLAMFPVSTCHLLPYQQ